MTRGDNFRELIAFLERHDFRFQTHTDEPLVHMQMTGENGSWAVVITCNDEKERFIALSRAPIHVPEPKRAAAAEYLTRANWGLMIGNFEMDYSDGEVRYKTAMDTDGIRLNDRLIGLTLSVNWRMLDRYLPGLMSVVYSDVSPEEAVRKIEAAPAGTSDREIEAAVRRLIEGASGENPPEVTGTVPASDMLPAPVERLRRWIHRGRG